VAGHNRQLVQLRGSTADIPHDAAIHRPPDHRRTQFRFLSGRPAAPSTNRNLHLRSGQHPALGAKEFRILQGGQLLQVLVVALRRKRPQRPQQKEAGHPQDRHFTALLLPARHQHRSDRQPKILLAPGLRL